MPGGQHGLGVRPNLVGYFTCSAHDPVAAYDNQINVASLHKVARGIVGDDLVRDALLRKFPRGEGGPLKAWAGFVAVDVKGTPQFLRRIHRCGRRTDIDESQPTGVAVGEYARARTDERGAMPSNGLALLHLRFRKSTRGGTARA